MKTVMFAGAGSVGKTMLLEALEKKARELGQSVLVFKSTTRKSYAKAGLQNEQAALQDPQFNLNHQHELMDHYCQELLRTAERGVETFCDLLICDRTPFDYAGYFFQVFQAQLNLQLISNKREQAHVSMRDVARCSTKTLVYNLAYPAPWSQDTESSDGWRADKTGKNFVWSALVNNELDHARRRGFGLDAKTRPAFLELSPAAERASPEDRALAVLEDLFCAPA